MATDELSVFLNQIHDIWGYDFRNYTTESMRRRVQSALYKNGWKSLNEALESLQKDSYRLGEFVSDLSVNVTELYRDPEVYLALRRHVLPYLRTYPSLKIWHAGCATGEEVYSMAILLKEEGLYDRSIIYGTDLSPRAIAYAKNGIYPASQIKTQTANYQMAGGCGSFSDYFTAMYESVAIKNSLKKNIVFAQHNLVNDEVFSEVHLILCRNVLIYFNQALQNKTLDLFRRSLVHKGFLCLGSKETLDFSDSKKFFQEISKKEKIYQLL